MVCAEIRRWARNGNSSRRLLLISSLSPHHPQPLQNVPLLFLRQHTWCPLLATPGRVNPSNAFLKTAATLPGVSSIPAQKNMWPERFAKYPLDISQMSNIHWISNGCNISPSHIHIFLDMSWI